MKAARALLQLALLVAGVRPLQGADGAPLNEALVREVAAIRAVAYRHLGPLELYASCTYCSSEVRGICTGHSIASWRQVVDFSWPGDADMAADGYALAQAWIAGLPAFSVRFGANADVLVGIEQAIRQGIGPNEQQRRDATQALLDMTGALGRSSMQLDAGVRALGVSIARQSAYRRALRQAIDGTARRQRCTDGVQARFDAISGEAAHATQEAATTIEQLEASDQNGEKALAALLGAVLNTRAEVESVLRLLAAAGTEQLGSYLERFDVAAARRQWTELASAAAP